MKWVNDPDGNQWEAFVVLEDDLPETDVSSQCGCGETDSSAVAENACCGTSAPEKIS